MKKKVSIITFSHALNFGAVVQAYALLRVVKDLGFDAQVIDYRPKFLRRNFLIIRKPFHSLKRIFNKINFARFCEKNLELSERTYFSAGELKKNPPQADFNICGSDQIWNLNITNGFDSAFFLDFSNDSVKRIAYAASMGTSNIPDQFKTLVEGSVKKFESISVREDLCRNEIRPLTSQNIVKVLDPSLLIDDYSGITQLPKTKYKDYIVVYCVNRYDNITPTLKLIKKYSDKKIINISQFAIKGVDLNVLNVSPEKWLGWIKQASHVFTNSFHGIAVSIKMSKQFSVIPFPHHKEGVDSRTLEILGLTQLTNRLVKNEKLVQENLENSIDYKSVQPLLNAEIINSKKFLIDSLK